MPKKGDEESFLSFLLSHDQLNPCDITPAFVQHPSRPHLQFPSILPQIHRVRMRSADSKHRHWYTHTDTHTQSTAATSQLIAWLKRLTSSALHQSGLSGQSGQTLSRDWIMLESPAPLSHLCPACKLYDPVVNVCVGVRMTRLLYSLFRKSAG